MPKKGDNLESVTASALIAHLFNSTMRYTQKGYPHESSVTKDVKTIFDSGTIETFDGVGNLITSESTRVICLISDLPRLEKGGKLTVNSSDYFVESYDKLNPYIVRLTLNDR